MVAKAGWSKVTHEIEYVAADRATQGMYRSQTPRITEVEQYCFVIEGQAEIEGKVKPQPDVASIDRYFSCRHWV